MADASQEVWCVLLPTKLGGYRTIGLYPGLDRLFKALLAPVFRQWDQTNAKSTDAARSGQNSEFSLFPRAIDLEVAHFKGHEIVQCLFDFQTYYDSIAVPMLAVDIK